MVSGRGPEVSTRVAGPSAPLPSSPFSEFRSRKEDTRYIKGRTEEVPFAGCGSKRWYLPALWPPSKPSLSRARTKLRWAVLIVLGGK